MAVKVMRGGSRQRGFYARSEHRAGDIKSVMDSLSGFRVGRRLR